MLSTICVVEMDVLLGVDTNNMPGGCLRRRAVQSLALTWVFMPGALATLSLSCLLAVLLIFGHIILVAPGTLLSWKERYVQVIWPLVGLPCHKSNFVLYMACSLDLPVGGGR